MPVACCCTCAMLNYTRNHSGLKETTLKFIELLLSKGNTTFHQNDQNFNVVSLNRKILLNIESIQKFVILFQRINETTLDEKQLPCHLNNMQQR